MTESKTISFKIGGRQGTQERHYNKEGIVYLKSIRASLTGLGWLFVISPFILGILATTVHAFFTLMGLAFSLIIYRYVREKDGATLGTLNGIDKYGENSVEVLEKSISNNIDDIIKVTGSSSSSLIIREYEYYFSSTNIVSVEQVTQRPISIGNLILTITLFSVPAALIAAEDGVGLAIGATILAILYYFLNSDSALEVRLQNGETESFIMSQKDINKVFQQFGNR